MQWLGRGTFALLAFCAMANTAAGQTRLGVRGGISSAEVTGRELGEVRRQTGLTVGGVLDVPIAHSVGVELGVSYVRKGLETFVNDIDLDMALDYLELPVLARWTVFQRGGLQSALYAGPVVALRVRCNGEAVQGPFRVDADCDDARFEGSLDTKGLDVGALMGVGAAWDLSGDWQLGLDAMYNVGLRAIDADPTVELDKNRVLMFRVGLLRALGR